MVKIFQENFTEYALFIKDKFEKQRSYDPAIIRNSVFMIFSLKEVSNIVLYHKYLCCERVDIFFIVYWMLEYSVEYTLSPWFLYIHVHLPPYDSLSC